VDRCLAEKVNGTTPLTRWACGRISQYRWRVRLELKLADLWLGVYLSPDPAPSGTIYVCVVPCLPLHVDWWKKWPRDAADDQAKEDPNG
jgi:hypothetical protein